MFDDLKNKYNTRTLLQVVQGHCLNNLSKNQF